jgi:hypothetical protein
VVLRDVFPATLVESAEREELPFARSLATRETRRVRKAESHRVNGPSAAALLDIMDSAGFVEQVRTVTGIDDLRADPTHLLAGLHVSGRGSFQALHTDFVRQPFTGWWHRVNVLLYLNSSWDDSYRGDLELWPSDLSARGALIRPQAGTTVIFETTSETVHGLPDRLRCPTDHRRLSLAAYYYTPSPPPGLSRPPLLRRPRRPQDPRRQGIAERGEIALGLTERVLGPFPAARRKAEYALARLGHPD